VKRRNVITVGLSLSLLLALCGAFFISTTFHHAAQAARPRATTPIAWPAFDGGGQRTGVNSSETTITTVNVGTLKQLWHVTLPATVDGAATELPNVQTAVGIKTLLYVTTRTGSLLAIDASNGTVIWSQNTTGPNYTTSSPAIDPAGTFVYGYGLDGKVHKYAVGTGAEVVNATWPTLLTNMPNVEKGSSSINIANGYLYMSIGGYPGDGGHYEGHIIAVNLSTGIKTVWNSVCANITHILGTTECADIQAAIWGRAAPTVDPVTGNIFVATGNGPFRGDGLSFGDSIIELTPNLSKVVDSYTPSVYATMQANDQDLGSTDPVLLPKQASSKTPYLLVQGSKDNNIRLVNRQNLSGQGGPNHVGGALQVISQPIKGDVDTQPAVWTDGNGVTWVFITNYSGLMAYKVVTTNGNTTLQLAYQSTTDAGSSPFIANGILFIQGNNVLYALNPTTGVQLWSSNQSSAGGSIGSLHWQSPIVVNGRVYVPDSNGGLTAYGLS
jgi:outer membrane protein assembly factor BamB